MQNNLGIVEKKEEQYIYDMSAAVKEIEKISDEVGKLNWSKSKVNYVVESLDRFVKTFDSYSLNEIVRLNGLLLEQKKKMENYLFTTTTLQERGMVARDTGQKSIGKNIIAESEQSSIVGICTPRSWRLLVGWLMPAKNLVMGQTS
ncbi:MAG: hypothetical protein WCH10_05505 [bacterium]